ncbi:RNA polymerase sigma factor [Curvibacter sp. HBC28]|uniref:RNA polymerase sigma factor n=1 Tax=Curvibacter microcysteis TaxID=3026419 RepID=A0ABT5MDC2_9BURK|nr:RNA polymerase sigma factor [Curvibacter sp. HBC28]MDD0814572.1 RNA polymerase sigma factor [Curvibacter sp. HBC28]
MSIPLFLDHLRRASAARDSFVDGLRRHALSRFHFEYPSVTGDDAEDAISQTLADLVDGKIKGFECDALPHSTAYAQALTTYLARQIAPRKLIDSWRKQAKDLAKVSIDELMDTPQGEAWLQRELYKSHQNRPPEAWELEHQLQLLSHCLNQLSAPLRSVVQGRLADESQAETAQRLGLGKVETVKSRMFSAIKKLQLCMKSQAPTQSVSP